MSISDWSLRVQSSRWLLALLFAALLQAQAPSTEAVETPDEADPGYSLLLNPAFPSPVVHEVPVNRGRRIFREDLAPYFAEGQALEARNAFTLQQWERVRTLLKGEPTTPPNRYLAALAALKQEDHAFAGPEFERLAEVWPPLKDRCLVLAGGAYEQLKDWAAAQRVYEQVAETSRQRADAALGSSRALRWLKNTTLAAKVLEPFVNKPAPPWGRDVGAEALLSAADVAAWRKDAKGEREFLFKLWSSHAVSPQAAKAQTRLGDISQASPETLVSRAEALIEAHRNVQGLQVLEPLLPQLKLPEPLACRAHFAYGKGQRKQRQHGKAIQALAPVVKQCTDSDLKARAQYVLGFSRSVIEPRQAAATYESLARDAPGHAYADDALFYAAEQWLKVNDEPKALKLLAELVERYPTGDFSADALFKRAWAHRAAKRFDEAASDLALIEQRFAANEDTYEVERAQYWRARIAEATGQPDAAADGLANLALAHPATYYGLIARERLTQLNPERGAAVLKEITAATDAVDPFPIYSGPLGDDVQFQGAVELLRMGFSELVPGELLSLDRTNLPPDSVRLMVHMLSLSGEARAAHGMARLWLRRDLSGPVTAQNRSLWEIAYPNVFRDLVERHCESANKLDPDLLQALMREESALDPKALSWAGALGLCQLMPSTAAEVAQKLKLKRPTQAALLEPDLNIRLGAQYLSDLERRLKGTRQYAIASYNAGEAAVGRWRRANPALEVDEWVEEIPLAETRGYVKRVLRSFNTYKLLYGAPLVGTQLQASQP